MSLANRATDVSRRTGVTTGVEKAVAKAVAKDETRPGYRILALVERRVPQAGKEIVSFFQKSKDALPEEELIASSGIASTITERLRHAVAADVNTYVYEILPKIWRRAWKDFGTPDDETFDRFAENRAEEIVAGIIEQRLAAFVKARQICASRGVTDQLAVAVAMQSSYWLPVNEASAVAHYICSLYEGTILQKRKIRTELRKEYDHRLYGWEDDDFDQFKKQADKYSYNRAYRQGYRAADGETVAAFHASKLSWHDKRMSVFEGLSKIDDVGLEPDDFTFHEKEFLLNAGLYDDPAQLGLSEADFYEEDPRQDFTDEGPSAAQQEHIREFEVWVTDKGPNVCAECYALEGTRVFPGEGFQMPHVGTGWALRLGRVQPGWHPNCHCDTYFEQETYLRT